MKHARDDYNRIQDPAGLIPEDEPVFLFRAQDSLAEKVLDFYAKLLVDEGIKLTAENPTGSEARAFYNMAEVVERQAQAFRDWNPRKLPDLQLPLFGDDEIPTP